MPNAASELFISYARSDEVFVRKLMHELERQGLPYWSDRKVAPGSRWIDEIESAIKRASVFVLVVSPDFEASDYALFEAGIAVGRAQESGAVIVPILLPGASLPAVLRGYQAVQAESMSVEDLAARLRSVVSTVKRKPERVFKELRLFVSSPGDMTAERECVIRVVEEVNATVGATQGIAFLRYTWEDVHAQVGRPQDVISAQLRNVDVFLLLLGARLGPPANDGSVSGTQLELRTAVEHWNRTGSPQVLCYFKTPLVKLQSLEQIEQFRRVLEFKDELRNYSVINEFDSLDDLERAVRVHLAEIIVSATSPPSSD